MTKKQPMPYMKLYTSYSDDPDYLELERPTRLRYWECYMLAFKADAAGDILNPDTGKPLTVKQIAMLLREDAAAVTSDLAALVTAELLTRKNNTWQITRYTEEQVNQAEFRQAAAERKAKQRGKPIQSNESQDNESDSESKKELNPNHQSSNSQDKTHNEVTRQSHVTEPDDRLIDDADINLLSMQWQEQTRRNATTQIKKLFKKALADGIELADIQEKIRGMLFQDADNPEAYITTCIHNLYPQEATAAFVLATILELYRRMGKVNLSDLNYLLEEQNFLPVTLDQVEAWQAEAKSINEE